MFPKTTSLEMAFQLVRRFCLIAVVLSFLFAGFTLYNSQKTINQANERIYILSSGKALEAFAADRRENIPVEARDHIRNFHHFFFTLDPDEKLITGNITKALYLADASAKRVYDNLKESAYYAGIISGNISQQVTVDSVSLDMISYPFYFRCYGTQRIIRTTSIVTRDLVTEGWLRTINRSDNNPHGFLIERWSILANKDIKVQER